MTDVHDLIRRHGHPGACERVAPADRRYVDLAAAVMADTRGTAGYLHSAFALTALPHRRLAGDADVWRRALGRAELLIEPGREHGADGPAWLGVPYGSRARLILLYLQTEAIRTGSPEIRLGNSMHHWFERMGVKPGGSGYAAVREQVRRLSACRLTVRWTDAEGADAVEATMLAPAGPRPDGEWDEMVRLTPEFFAALRGQPLPVAEAAVRLVQNSSAVLDVYVWLCLRLRTLTRPTDVAWPDLHRQFGPDYKQIRQFRAKFLTILREALAVYPGARVEVTAQGVRLLPSRPAVAAPRTFFIGVAPPAGPWS